MGTVGSENRFWCIYYYMSTKILLCCHSCEKKFHRNIGDVNAAKKLGQSFFFCSLKCSGKHKTKKITVYCQKCNKFFNKDLSQIKQSNNNFCSRSCSAIYNNGHKKRGTRRSKLEVFLESNLKRLYPDLEIHFNRKDAINSELDIYIPSLNLAFELNGIFHYEPIYGKDKLQLIQNNDQRKFQACLENNIELCIIDSSQLKYFKPSNAQKYLNIVVDIINAKIK